MTPQTSTLTRRAFAFGISAAVGGLIIGAPPFAAAVYPPHPHPSAEVTIWVVIEDDNTTTIRIARSEMGQGSFTALAMLVAEELECDWLYVRAEYVDSRENVVRGRPWGDMVTASSIAIRGSQAYLRKAGAWTEAWEQALLQDSAREVDAAVSEYLNTAKPSTDAMFDSLFAELPLHLREQRATARKYGAKPSGH